MERARHDRFVWTDEDCTHSPDCLDRFAVAEQKHGPAIVIPNFVGDEWWRLVEPTSTVVSKLSMYLGRGPWAGDAWDGGVIFTRDDVNVAELVADLRQCLSDDGALLDHPETVYPIRAMIADVVGPGDFASVKERMARFTRITHVHEGLGGPLVTSLLCAVLALFFPLYSIPLITVASGVTYARLGKKRWTFILAYPALLILLVLFIAGITRKEFEWAAGGTAWTM
jgi:hypothetical protein